MLTDECIGYAKELDREGKLESFLEIFFKYGSFRRA